MRRFETTFVKKRVKATLGRAARRLAGRLAEQADQIALGEDVAVHRREQGLAIGAGGQVQPRVEREQLEVIMLRPRAGRPRPK